MQGGPLNPPPPKATQFRRGIGADLQRTPWLQRGPAEALQMTGTRAATRIHSYLRGDPRLTIYLRGTHTVVLKPYGDPTGYTPTNQEGVVL